MKYLYIFITIRPSVTLQIKYEHGYKLGVIDGDKVYLHNHLIINLKYNRLDSDDNLGPSYRIVGFDVLPHSIDEMKPGMIIQWAYIL